MSTRLLWHLLAVLVLLLIAWLAAYVVTGGDDEEGPESMLLPAGAELELDSVVITSATGTIRLRANDGWTVNGYEALPDAGAQLERALLGARLGELVSRNPANHGRLGVAEAAGRRLTAYAGGEPRLTLIIGGRTRVLEQVYVRRPGADEVYTLTGSLVGLASRNVEGWRNREIVTEGRDDIQRIELTYPDETFALVRDSVGWRVEPSGRAAVEGTVSSLLNQLAGLRAIGFAPDSVAEALAWDSLTGRVRVMGPGGASLAELEFLERADEVGYYVRRAGRPVVYSLSSWSGDQILKREEELAEAAGEISG